MNFNINQTIPPPTGDVLALITSLSNPANHTLHTQALSIQSTTLSSSPISYGQTCLQYARVLACASPTQISQADIEKWSNTDGGVSVMQLRHDPINGWNAIRQMAGYLLKNALCKPPLNNDTKMLMRLLPDAAYELKIILCQSIVDEQDFVRKVSSSIIASCTVGSSGVMDGMEALPLSEWGTILTPFLVNCLESAISMMEGKLLENNNDHIQSTTSSSSTVSIKDKVKYALLGSLMTLSKLLEDNAKKFEIHSGPSFHKIIPCLLKLLKVCSDKKVKIDSLKCCVHMIHIMPSSLVAQMNDFLGILSSLGNDECYEVRQLVCRAIVEMLSKRTNYLSEHFFSISQFMLQCTTDTNQQVAIDACEYWLTFASLDEDVVTKTMLESVQSLFPQLIPTLVKCMVYPQDKIEELLERNAIDEQQGEDRAQDIAPVFHRSKAKGGGNDGEHDEHNDSDDDDDDDDDDFDDREWSLRTCAAASLDGIASGYPHEIVLSHLLPTLQESLSHDNPWVREAGILALGAISNGCGEAMSEHMSQLHPYLLNQVTANDSLPQLKSISCWTISMYAAWALEQAASGIQPDLVQHTIEAVLNRILDKNRRVQVSACSALGDIIEQTGEFAFPYLEMIYRTLSVGLERLQTRSLMVLLDIYDSIANAVGPASGEGNLPSIYVPPLLAMWATKAKANPLDRVLLPLMESLGAIASTIGMNYQPWALQTFDGAMSMINSCLMILSCSESCTDEDADSLICATDILDGLVEGLGSNFTELVSNSRQFGEHLPPILRTLIGHEVDGVRVSAFALMGDIAKHCPVVIQDCMAELLNEAISSIDVLYPSVCNNAIWAIGEVCVKCIGNPAALEPFAPEIVQSLLVVLMESGFADSPAAGLVENAASTMGRLAKVNAMFVAGELPRFLNRWCDGCAKIFDLTERRDAFEGLMLAIQANPQSIALAPENVMDILTSLLFAVISWHIPNGKINQKFLVGPYKFESFPNAYVELCNNLRTFLHRLKEMYATDWKSIENGMPVNVRRLFRESYGFA